MRLELHTVCGCRRVVRGEPLGLEFRVPLHVGRSNADPTASSFTYRRFDFEAEYDHPLHGRTWVMRERYER